jgi:hypothetical protein
LSRLYNGSWNQEKLWQDFELRYLQGSWVDAYMKWVEKPGRIPNMNIFNASSFAIRSTLEAFRLADGYSTRRVFLRGAAAPYGPWAPKSEAKAEKPEADDYGEWHVPKNAKKSDRGYHDVRGARRWMVAYCGSPLDYQIFIMDHIDQVGRWSKFTPEQMYDHYMRKYPGRKILQIQHVLAKGDLLIREVSSAVRQIR